MATLDSAICLDEAHFNNFRGFLPGLNFMCKITCNYFLKRGMLQVSTAFEHALANAGGYNVDSKAGRDFSNGDEGKIATVRYSSNGTQYSAAIRRIKNKTGYLRIQVYERKQDKFYYFVIPNSAYKDIPPSSNIEIPFEFDGTPKRMRTNGLKYDNMWNYEVSTFTECATLRPRRKRKDIFKLIVNV